jgi:4-hydroxybenzoate polyprenyltransferase
MPAIPVPACASYLPVKSVPAILPFLWCFFVLLFITSAFMLNKLAFYLSPVALLVILGYSLTKRFTSYTHFVLGLGLGLAPLGAWIAITGQFNMLPVVLAAGVLLWVAGFDIIYACQDYDYDRNHQLFSLPVRIGLKNALLLTRILHLLAIILFVWVGLLFAAHIVYYIGMLIIFGLLLWEHSIIRADDLTRIDMAFFNLNGTVSIIYLLTVLFALYLEH